MKTKKPSRKTVHDLRDIDPVEIGVPGVAGELAGETSSPGMDGPRIVTPGVGVQAPGQTTHE